MVNPVILPPPPDPPRCRCSMALYGWVWGAEREYVTLNLSRNSIARETYLRLLPSKTWGFCERHDATLRGFAFSLLTNLNCLERTNQK